MARARLRIAGAVVLALLALRCTMAHRNPEDVVLVRADAFRGGCRFLAHVENDGPIDLSSPARTGRLRSRAAAMGGNVVVVPTEGPGVTGGDVYACGSLPVSSPDRKR